MDSIYQLCVPFWYLCVPKKTLACEIFKFLFIYFCTYISGDFFIVCFKSISFQESRNNKTGKKPPKTIQSLEKPHVTLSKNASVLRQLFGVGFFGWMWPARSQVFVAITKKPWWFQRFLHVKHARLEEMIYKYVKNMGENHKEKILKLLIGRL